MSTAALSDAARAARRLGCLGGSFDPPHLGHLHAARAARGAFALDHVLFIPAALPPHKQGRRLAPPSARAEMTALLLQERPWASVWTGELERPGPSYTVETARELRALLPPPTELHWIIGSDNLAGLPTWREADELLELVRPIVVLRRGDRLDPELLGALPERARRRIEEGFVELEPLEISASELRAALASGRVPPASEIPDGVARYALERELYRESR